MTCRSKVRAEKRRAPLSLNLKTQELRIRMGATFENWILR